MPLYEMSVTDIVTRQRFALLAPKTKHGLMLERGIYPDVQGCRLEIVRANKALDQADASSVGTHASYYAWVFRDEKRIAPWREQNYWTSCLLPEMFAEDDNLNFKFAVHRVLSRFAGSAEEYSLLMQQIFGLTPFDFWWRLTRNNFPYGLVT